MTLMMLLLREVLGVEKPFNGWHRLPRANDITEGADLVRIRHYRNEIVHKKDCFLNNRDFKIMWKEMKEAMNRLANNNFDFEIQHLLLKRLDRTQIDLERELSHCKQEVTQHRARYPDEQTATMQWWRRNDETFIETGAAVAVRNSLLEGCFVIIIGTSGSGKSAIAHHFALKMQKEGYKVIPVMSMKDVSAMWVPEEKQLFVLDDPLGKLEVDISEINNWQRLTVPLNVILEDKKTKIITSMRKHVMQDKRVSALLSDLKGNIEDKVEESIQIVDISAKQLLLSISEKRSIFESHVSNKGKEIACKESVINCDLHCFPLLCHLFASDRESRLNIDDFFKSPYSVFREEFEKLRNFSRRKYFGLVLCMIYDNNLNADLIMECDQNDYDTLKIKKFLHLCELSDSEPRLQIQSDLESLVGTYLVKEFTSYKFFHDFIHDALVSTLPNTFHEAILQYASAKFIRERVRVYSYETPKQEKDSCMFLSENLKHILGNRLVTDIKNGHLYDVFFNTCLQQREYEIVLVQSLEATNEIENLICSKATSNLHDSLKEETESLEHLDDEILPFCDQYRYNLLYLMFSLLDEEECTPLHWIVARKLDITFHYLWNKLRNSSKHLFLSSLTFLLLSCFGGSAEIVQTLIKNGARINRSNKEGWTPIYAAAYSGSVEVAKALFDNGANIDDRDNEGSTPLIVASYNGHAKMVQMLVDKGAKVDVCDNYGWSATYAASYNGHESVVKILIEKQASLENSTIDGRTPLIAAASNGYDGVLKLLISEGADVNKCTQMLRTALYEASSNGRENVLQTLIDNKVEINKCDKNGCTSLYAACHRGHDKVVKMLIKNKADIHKINKYGWTPVYAASSMGHVTIVQDLNASGADITRRDDDGWTPLYAASISGHVGVTRTLLENLKNKIEIDVYDKDDLSTPLNAAACKGYNNIVQMLLQHEANINACDKYGCSPLYNASEKGHYDIVQSLVQQCADLNKCDDENSSPLYASTINGHLNIVQLLVNSGADVNKCDSEGRTPLFISSRDGQLDIVKVLLNNDADVNIPDKDSITPLAIAIINKHKQVETLLLRRLRQT